MENEISNLIVQDNLSNEEIKNLIYTIRGKQVMLDSDVAMLYHYETKKINQAVKRNIERFVTRARYPAGSACLCGRRAFPHSSRTACRSRR